MEPALADANDTLMQATVRLISVATPGDQAQTTNLQESESHYGWFLPAGGLRLALPVPESNDSVVIVRCTDTTPHDQNAALQQPPQSILGDAVLYPYFYTII